MIQAASAVSCAEATGFGVDVDVVGDVEVVGVVDVGPGTVVPTRTVVVDGAVDGTGTDPGPLARARAAAVSREA
jgi:hypothetical protein